MLGLTLHSPIFINKSWNQKLKIQSKLIFRLNTSDIYMNYFIMSLKYKNLFILVFFTDFYIAYLLKSFLRVMF
jgi:hypothetical protein